MIFFISMPASFAVGEEVIEKITRKVWQSAEIY
jgi:hypothetical protein